MKRAGLARELSLFDISTMSAASMGPAYSLAATMGPFVVLAGMSSPLVLLFVSCCMLCTAAGYGALSSRFPAAGSSYSWVYRAFGRYVAAFVAWILIVANLFAMLATALPAGAYTLDLLAPQFSQSPLIVAIASTLWVVASGALLAAGVRPTAGLTAIFLLIEVLVLGTSAALAATMHPIHPASGGPLLPTSLGVFLQASVLGIWMIDGWELSAATSEEGRDDRVSGRGGIRALVGTSLVLLMCMSAYLHLLGPRGFVGRESDAMTVVADSLGGEWRWLIVATVLVSTSATLWTTMLYLTRSLFAMGRDHVLPSPFAALDARNMPTRALVIVTATGAATVTASGFFPSVAGALTFVLAGSGVFLGSLFVFTSASAYKLVPSPRSRLLAVLAIVGIAGALIAEIADPANVALRVSGFIGAAMGIPFAMWRGRASSLEVL